MEQLQAGINEIKTSQSAICDRINCVVSQQNEQEHNCNCNQHDLRKDISELNIKCDELKNKSDDIKTQDTTLKKDVRELQSRLEAIEKLLEANAAVDGITEDEDTTNKAESEDACSREATGGATSHTVDVVKQDVKLVYNGEQHWKTVAQFELDAGRRMFIELEGVHSIICLDISESMSEGNSWTEASTFLTEYLMGLDEMSKQPGLKTEHVALVTFGHQTELQTRYTDKYSEVQNTIDNLRLGGPTQMYGGMLFALAAAWSKRQKFEVLENSTQVHTKIIIITDGRPTELDLIGGPDIADSRKMDETNAKILQEMERFRESHIDVFFVPVGKPDIGFIETMKVCSGGEIFRHTYGRRLARRQYLSSRLLDPLGLLTDELTQGHDNDLSQEDKTDMRNIQKRAHKHVVEMSSEFKINYGEFENTDLPPVGSRVRRGPDWTHGNQDSNGPGTVIGHEQSGNGIWVEWDADEHRNFYKYNIMGYDALIVDEPRALRPGERIAVGCRVKPGKDWKAAEVTEGNGVVIRLDKRRNKATVRWNIGKRGDYSYGGGGQQEIEIVESDGKPDHTRFSETTHQSGAENNRSNYSDSGYVIPESSDNYSRTGLIEDYAASHNIM